MEQIQATRIQIGKQIAEIRQERNMTQQQVADATGIKRPHVARAEAGRYNIGIDTLAKIAKAIGAEIHVVAKE